MQAALSSSCQDLLNIAKVPKADRDITQRNSGFLMSSYLVSGTSSLWSKDTEDDLLMTAGENVRKASVLVVGEHEKSALFDLCGSPFD